MDKRAFIPSGAGGGGGADSTRGDFEPEYLFTCKYLSTLQDFFRNLSEKNLCALTLMLPWQTIFDRQLSQKGKIPF